MGNQKPELRPLGVEELHWFMEGFTSSVQVGYYDNDVLGLDEYEVIKAETGSFGSAGTPLGRLKEFASLRRLEIEQELGE